jgi:hypothetical protein
MIPQNHRNVYYLLFGFTVWTLGFIGIYAVQALGCAYDFGVWHRPMLITAYVLTLMLLGAIAIATSRRAKNVSSPLASSALWANWAAFASALLIFAPVGFASTCQ